MNFNFWNWLSLRQAANRSGLTTRRKLSRQQTAVTSEVQTLESRVVLSVTVLNATVVEPASGQASMVFTLTRTGDLTQSVGVSYQTQDGTAKAGVDYTATSGTAYFGINNSTTTVSVPILSNPNFTGKESFSLQLTGLVDNPPAFTGTTTFPTVHTPDSQAAADFNGDGKLDLVVGSPATDTFSVLFNTTVTGSSTPSFSASQTFSTIGRPAYVAVGDLNGDGKPDIVTGNYYSSNLGVYINETSAGSSTINLLAPVNVAPGGGSPSSLVIADVNGDGKPDIVTQVNNSVSVLINTTPTGSTNPTFAPPQTFAVPQHIPRSVLVTDLNGDGMPDIAVTENYGQAAVVMMNTTVKGSSTVTFAPQVSIPDGNLAHKIASGDLTGDGQQDIVITSGNDGTVTIFPNTTATGADSFTYDTPIILQAAEPTQAISIADVTGDGRPDLIVSEGPPNVSYFLVYPNTTPAGSTTPTFGNPVQIASGSAPNAFLPYDFNGDGITDLAYVNEADDTVGVSLGDPLTIGTSSATGTIYTYSTITAPAAASLNQGATLAFTGSNAISVTDPSGTTEQLMLAVSFGTLKLNTTTGLTVTGNGSATVTLTGTLATLNNDLASLVYTPTAGFHGTDTLTLANTDTSDNLTSNSSVALTIKPLAPAITAPASISVNQSTAFAFTGSNLISVSDPSGTTEQLTLAVSHGTLTLSNQTGLSVSGNGTATLTLTGALATLNSDLSSLTYTSASGYHGADTLSLSNVDTSDSLSATKNVSVTVKPLAPTITAPASATVNQSATLAFTGSNAISVADLSGTAEQLTLTVSNGTLALGTTSGLTVTGNGTLTLKLTGALSNLNTALASLVYTPTAGYHGSDTLSLSNLDTSDSLTGTKTVALTVKPLAPTITAPTSASVSQNATVAFTGTNAISLSDLSGTAEQLTLSVSHGTLALGTTTGLTISGNGTATVTVTGSLASLNSDLTSLVYTPTAGYHGADAVSLSLKDTTDSLTASKSIAVTVNPLAPSITAAATASLNQGSTLTFAGANAITVADPSGTAEQFTVSVSHGTLALGTTTGLTVGGSGTATLTLTGALASLNADLASLVYTPTAGYHGTDTVNLSNKDTADSLTATKSIVLTINPLPPVISAVATASVNQGATLAFTGTNAISISDPSGTTEQLTVAVGHGVLTFGTTTGLTVTGNASATVTLTGTLSSLNSALASLTYTATAGYHGADTLSLSNKDTTDSLTATKSISLTIKPLAPTITAVSSASVNQGATLALTGVNAISISDPSGTAEQLTLSVSHGTLAVGTTTGLTVTGNGTATVTLTGTLSSLNSDLASLVYTPTAGYHGADTLSLTNKDTSDSLTATKSISLTVNALPSTITAPTTASLSQGSTLVFTGAQAIRISDPSGTAEQLTLSVSHGTLKLGTTTGLTVTGSGTASLVLTGPLASLNSDLASLVYTPTAGYHGADTLNLTNKDTADNLTVGASVALTITPLAPTITAAATVSVNQGATLAFTGANAISVADQSGTAEQFVLSVNHGTLTLGTVTGLTVAGNGTATVTLTGTLASLNSDLASLVYAPTAGYHGADTLSLSNKDTADNLTATKTVSLTVAPLAPTITAVATASVNQGATLSLTGANAVSVTDPSGVAEQMTLSVSHGILKLSSTTGLTVTGNGTATVKLVGSLSNLNNSLQNLSYTPTAGYHGSDAITLSNKDAADGLTATKSIAITVNPLAPTIAAVSTATVAQGGTLAFTGANAISVADPSGTAEQLTLSVSHGILTLGTATGLTVAGNGTSTLTLTGTLASLNSDLTSLTYTPTAGYHGADTLSLSDKDTADTLTVARSIGLTVTPLAPTINAVTAASVNQGATLAFTGANVISVADPSGVAEQLTLSVSHGTLKLSSTTGLTVTGNGTATVTLVGSLTNLNNSLPSLSYTPTAGYHGADTLTLFDKDASDGLTVTKTVGLTVVPLPPTISAPTTASVTAGTALTFTGTNAISVADPSGTAEQLTITVTHGTLKLGTTTGLTVTGNGTATITLTGTLASLNSDLASLTYTPVTGYLGSDTLSLSNKDTSDGLTVTKTVALTVHS